MSDIVNKIVRKGHVFKLQGVKVFFIANGCSWRGKTTKRDGKTVTCGHKHKTEEAARKCVKQMRKTKPGNCQDYRTAEIHLHIYKRQD